MLKLSTIFFLLEALTVVLGILSIVLLAFHWYPLGWAVGAASSLGWIILGCQRKFLGLIFTQGIYLIIEIIGLVRVL
jgi:hypothetical protein